MTDLITAALFAWHDLPRQQALVAALHACLTQCGRADDGACDTHFVNERPLVVVTRTPPLIDHPALALEALAADMTSSSAALDQQQQLVTTARAMFLVLFLLDGRVRRFVLAPHRGHALMRTQPPPRQRVLTWLTGCARIDTMQSLPVAVARRYAEDAYEAASAWQGRSLFADVDQHDAAAANDAFIVADLKTRTHDFVEFMRHWWLLGRPSLAPPPPDDDDDDGRPPASKKPRLE